MNVDGADLLDLGLQEGPPAFDLNDQFGPIVDTTDETFDAVFGLNLRAAWLASQLFAREAIRAESSLALRNW